MDSELPGLPRRRRDDRGQDRASGRLRKGMYILPSLFTTANIAAGYYAILQVTHATAQEAWHFDNAAIAIGFAVLFDGLDGRIARMTKTSSDFGKELDSLADVVTFGVAPALLAWMWGFRQLPVFLGSSELTGKMVQIGAIFSFLFLTAGASRLARFNITANAQPSNPGRPGKKYFVGMPIPAGAGVIAAVVHFSAGDHFLSLELHYLAADCLRHRLFDGQHVALLQLQRHRFSLAATFSPHHSVCVVVRRHLVFLASIAVRPGAHLHGVGSRLAFAVGVSPPWQSTSAHL
jgi:CDP-diacylglycerol--serine O-phosphatidyltransferase